MRKTNKQKLKALWENVNKNDAQIEPLKKKSSISYPKSFTKKITTLEYVLVQITDLTKGYPDKTYKLCNDTELQELIIKSYGTPQQDVTSNFSLESNDEFFLERSFENLTQNFIPFLHIVPILETEEGFPFPVGIDLNDGGIFPEFNYWWRKIPNQTSKGYVLKMCLQIFIDQHETLGDYPLYFRLKIFTQNQNEWRQIERNKV